MRVNNGLRLLLALLCGFVIMGSGMAMPQVTIAIVSDGSSERVTQKIGLLQAEINALLDGEYQVSYQQQAYQGDWQLAQVQQAFRQAQRAAEVDLVIAYGPVASDVAVSSQRLAKPTIATIFLDAELQSVPRKNTGSGRKNLTYIQPVHVFAKDLRRYREIVPFTQLAIIADASLGEIASFRRLLAEGAKQAEAQGVSLSFLPMTDQLSPLLAKIDQQLDAHSAVYLLPNERLTDEQISELGQALLARRIPAFAMQESQLLSDGFLAAYSHADSFKRERRRVALNVRDILNGEPASELPVDLALEHQLYISQQTADDLGIPLRWSTLKRAQVIAAAPTPGLPHWNLASVAQTAVDNNLTLLAAQREYVAGQQVVNLAEANRRPQVAVELQHTRIDSDRARFSNGNSAERDLSAALILQQSLYSEEVWANVAVQRSLDQSRNAQLEVIRLDTIEQASLAYVSVLRAQSLVAVETSNLALTQANLRSAQRRVAAGVARKSEVFRWQSQRSQNQRSLLDAQSQEANARLQLNQVLQQPLPQDFTTAAMAPDHAIFSSNRDLAERYITGPTALAAFTQRSERYALERAAEVQSVQAILGAQQRLLQASKRQYYVPDVSLQASVRERLSRDGDGSAFPPGVEINNTDTSVALVLSLPLYAGGGRGAEVRQAAETLAQVRYQLASADQQVRQRVRLRLNQMRASFPGIELSEQALEAAEQNYAIVRDAYARGTLSIIDFLDAQNQAFSAERAAVNARYDFVEDYIQYQRAISHFFYLEPEVTTPEVLLGLATTYEGR